MSQNQPDPRGYWRANLRLVASLLIIWAFVSFGLSIGFVESLNTFRVGGFPLGFWFAQQGSIYTFIALVFIYAVASDRLARRYGVE
jgi:putative solute:sodium symporter small subunit